MHISERVGTTAGMVWRQLVEGGPQTLTQLKKKLNGESDLVNFAVGWLAREDKIEIIPDKRNFRVQLK